jgi:hypothetical protein
MSSITIENGKIVVRDGKVGTEQACCCGSCGCNLCDGDQIVVTIENQDLALPTAGQFEYLALEEIAQAGNSLGCVRALNALWQCGSDIFWDSLPFDKPSPWPNEKIVVWAIVGWQSNDDINICGQERDLLYVMECDQNGCPSVGEVFYDSGAVDQGDCNAALIPPELSYNVACQGLPAPTSVNANPLP